LCGLAVEIGVLRQACRLHQLLVDSNKSTRFEGDRGVLAAMPGEPLKEREGWDVLTKGVDRMFAELAGEVRP